MPVEITNNLTQGPSCHGCCTRLVDLGVTIGSVEILKNVNLHVHCGEITAIIGPNGAGKTTLFRAMLNEIPYSGALKFMHEDGETEFRKPRIGYVPQKLAIDVTSPITVFDLFATTNTNWPVWLGRSPQLRKETIAILESVHAGHLIDKKIGALSGGEVQRVLLALALMPTPDLLLLDEPAASMDQSGMEMFYKTVADLRLRYHLSILLISHDLAGAAEIADRMIFLKQTILFDGTPAAVMNTETINSVFGINFSRLPPAKTKGACCDKDHTCCNHAKEDGHGTSA